MNTQHDGGAAHCVLCGQPGRDHLTGVTDREPGGDRRRWTIAHCAACGLYWLKPRPTAADFAALYRDDYYTHAATAAPPTAPGGVAAAVIGARYGYHAGVPPLRARLARLVGPLAEEAAARVRFLPATPGGTLLDVGCGNGEFLGMMRALGWRVTGVEPDENAVRAAHPDVRAALHAGTVETIDFAPESFDAITLHHVIEHLPDPLATLRRLRGLLRPGGRLVLMTPNADSLGRRIFGRAWLHWDPPRHTFLFTRRSLAAAARRAGFAVLEERTISRGARWTWRESRRLAGAGGAPQGDAPAGRARGPAAIAFHALEYTTQPFARWGEEVVVVAGPSPTWEP